MAIYMRTQDIKGNVTTQGLEGAILLYTVVQRGARSISYSPGTCYAREMSGLLLNPIQIAKGHDAASAGLYDYFCSGKTIDEIELLFCPLSHDTSDWSAKYTLHYVTISLHHELLNGMGGQELIELAYTKIEKGYKQQNEQGQLQAPRFTGYDLASATRI